MKISTLIVFFLKRLSDNDFVILLLYVDDMLIVGHDAKNIKSLENELSKNFSMKNLGYSKQIFGMRITHDKKHMKLWLSQEKYIEKVLERFNMNMVNNPLSTLLAGHFKLSSKEFPTSEKQKEEMLKIPFASTVSSLMYAMAYTRLDIAHAHGDKSRFLLNLGKQNQVAVKSNLRYLTGTSRFCLCYGNENLELSGDLDKDYVGDMNSRKSTLGYMMTFVRGAILWQSKLKKCAVLSTTEANYVIITQEGKKLLWMQNFLQELGLKQKKICFVS